MDPKDQAVPVPPEQTAEVVGPVSPPVLVHEKPEVPPLSKPEHSTTRKVVESLGGAAAVLLALLQWVLAMSTGVRVAIWVVIALLATHIARSQTIGRWRRALSFAVPLSVALVAAWNISKASADELTAEGIAEAVVKRLGSAGGHTPAPETAQRARPESAPPPTLPTSPAVAPPKPVPPVTPKPSHPTPTRSATLGGATPAPDAASIVPRLPIGVEAFPIVFDVSNGPQQMLAVDCKCVFDRVILGERNTTRIGKPMIDNIGTGRYIESIKPGTRWWFACPFVVDVDKATVKVAEATVTLNIEFGEPDKPGRKYVRRTWKLVSELDRLRWEQTTTRQGPIPELGVVGHLGPGVKNH